MIDLDDVLGVNNAIVVAHPDDLAMFFAGLAVHYKFREWTAICCSIPHNDKYRAYRFFESCSRINVKPILIPLEEPATDILQHLEWLQLKHYDSVITHNKDDNHNHHQQVSRAVSTMCKPIYQSKEGNVTLKLTVPEVNKKIKSLQAFDYKIDYQGQEVTKWESLIQRYCQDDNYDMMIERYIL